MKNLKPQGIRDLKHMPSLDLNQTIVQEDFDKDPLNQTIDKQLLSTFNPQNYSLQLQQSKLGEPIP
jgi:hypothetical protein